MMSTTDLAKIEQERQTLEQNLVKLKANLRHWQTWEAEYEGLKEDLDAVDDPVDHAALVALSTSYEGDLVNEKEIRDLTGLNKGTVYSPTQIKNLISRRQDYVQKNIETIQRQFWDAEAKLEEFDFASFTAQRDSNGGLPLTEISEELDDDDNVVSSRLSHPEDASTKIVETLKKAGLTQSDLTQIENGSGDVIAETEVKSAMKDASDHAASTSVPMRKDSSSDSIKTRKKAVSFSADTKRPVEPPRTDLEDGKKSVSFAEKVAIAPAAPVPVPRSVSFATSIEEIPATTAEPTPAESKPNSEIQKTLRASFKPGEKVYELAEDDTLAATHFVLPESETDEEARLRREMIEYNLNEVGHVVAELNLEGDDDYDDVDDANSTSDFTSSEHPDEDTPYTSGLSDTEDEDEDEFGRSRKAAVSDDYHKQMQELQARLIGNLGPAPSATDLTSVDSAIDPADVRRLVIRDGPSNPSSALRESSTTNEKRSGSTSSKKRVSFADALDVAPLTQSQPLTSTITERVTSQKPPERDIQDDEDEHRGPKGQIMSETLLERPLPSSRTVVAPGSAAFSADEEYIDEEAERRALAETYYRHRNAFIRQQPGGFTRPDEKESDNVEEMGELMEERDGKVKKVSRFKAARIRS